MVANNIWHPIQKDPSRHIQTQHIFTKPSHRKPTEESIKISLTVLLIFTINLVFTRSSTSRTIFTKNYLCDKLYCYAQYCHLLGTSQSTDSGNFTKLGRLVANEQWHAKFGPTIFMRGESTPLWTFICEVNFGIKANSISLCVRRMATTSVRKFLTTLWNLCQWCLSGFAHRNIIRCGYTLGTTQIFEMWRQVYDTKRVLAKI